jgi:MFS family permease
MMTLGIVILVNAVTGSYSLAGQVSAAFTIGLALFAVPHGRLSDRFGQGPVLYVDSIAFALTGALMIVSIHERWALPLPHLLALLTGAAMPQIGTLVRGRWAHLLDTDAERHTAFAVEGVADEAVFVTGPAIVTFLSTLHDPASGLVVAVVVGSLGALALAVQRRTQPPAHPRDPVGGTAPMPWGFLVPLTLCGTALGSLFGAQEVAAVAAADDAGNQAFSGVMLGLFSLGSLLAGLVAGAVTFRRGPRERARIGMVPLCAGTLVLPLLDGLVPVTVALFVTGLALAPTLIAVFSLIEAAVPRSRLNESMGFVQTGVGAGLAPGAWLAGVVADSSGGQAAFWVGAASAVLATVAAFTVPEVRRPAEQPSA